MKNLSTRKTIKVISVIAINFVLLFVLVYGLDMGLRFLDPKRELPVNGIVDGTYISWGHEVRLNKHSYRENEFPITKPKNTYRLMVLGDSFTWGEGVAIEERFTSLLQKLLQDRFPNISIEILNFGIRGATTMAERDVLKAWKDIIHPDRILVGFCINDPQPYSQDFSEERNIFLEKHGHTLLRASRQLKKWGFLYLGRNLRRYVLEAAEFAGVIPHWTESLQRAYDEDSKEWKDFVQSLVDIRKMSDEMKLKAPLFAVLTQAYYRDRPTTYDRPDPKEKLMIQFYDKAEKAAEKAGFKTLNFMEPYTTLFSDQVPVVNVLDTHPSPELHDMYAKTLFEYLLAEGSLQKEAY